MHTQPLRRQAVAFVAGVAILVFSGWASADPPSRVARLGYMSGAVSFSPAGEVDWVQASINRPLTTGDRLWSDARARAEIQVGGAMIRMNAGTGVSVLNLDDRIAQLQLTQGTLNVRVRRLEPNQVFEVDTPNLALTLRQPGEYRIEVDPDGNATTIVMRRGQGEVYGEDASYVIDSRQPYRFIGTGLREYQYVDAPRLDDFDRWASDRDRAFDISVSARYVSQDVVGYQDLDANGTWRNDATYGNVWVPNRVAVGWAPYRDGHWAWVDPWGWTWVDDAPWGFAVSHYGRWANLGGTWGWVPGPVRTRAYYAPALVVFVGGANFQLTISSGNVGGVAWFPLGPREVYRPSYTVSRGYFENVNQSNTVINNTVINNVYNNTNVTNVVYANRQVPGAIVAVPTTAFVQSQPVSRAAVKVSQEVIVSRPVAVAPPVAPTQQSVHGAAAQGDKPPARVFERPVVARTAPPAAHVGFAAQQQQLTAKPGTPLDDTARKELKPAAAAPAPVVKVVAPTQESPRAMVPPPATPAVRPADASGKSDERKAPASPAISTAPVAPTQGAAPSLATPPVPAAQAPEQRGKAEQRGKPEQRGQPVAAPAPAAPPKVAAPAPTAQPPEERGKAEQRGKPDQRGQPVAAPAPAAPPQVAAPAPTAQPPEERGKAEQRGKPEQRGQPVATPAPAAVLQVAPPAAVAQQPAQRVKPEPPSAAKPAEPRPVASAKPPPPQAQPASGAELRGHEPKPAASKPQGKKKDSDEQKREEEDRKQKG
ncbi:DUF6600 domain-containing protein [Piscinibacter sp.]|uniref:DUF6600 domain-containing protein n=1 Tax=Piscinibacter sp. TaxID=1903157 RepID=UPI002F42632A